MYLVDTNIIMYAAGAPHPYKEPSARLLRRVARGEIDATIDAETLQEILHRYRAISRWEDGRMVFDLARQIFPQVIPVDAEILDVARHMLDRHPSLMARDTLHAAVVMVESLDGIITYDRDFDHIAEVRRVDPTL